MRDIAAAAGVAGIIWLVVGSAGLIALALPSTPAQAQYNEVKPIEVQIGSRTVQCIQMRTAGGYGAALSCDWSKP